MGIKKITELSMLLALSVVLNMVENAVPIFNGLMPGVKLGMANTVILFVIYAYGFKEGIYVSILRVVIVGILFSGLFSPMFLFSISGAIISMMFMFVFKKIAKLSIIGVSIMGSIGHSIGQILMAIVILKTISIIYYLPWLILFAIPTGIVIGTLSKQLLKQFGYIKT